MESMGEKDLLSKLNEFIWMLDMGIIDFQESPISWTTNQNSMELPREENYISVDDYRFPSNPNFKGKNWFIDFPGQLNPQSLENKESENLSLCPERTDHTTPVMLKGSLASDSNVNLDDVAKDEKLRLEKKRNRHDDPWNIWV